MLLDDAFSVVAVVAEVIFIVAMGRRAWQNRKNQFVFWGWLVVLAMFVALDLYYYLSLR